MKRWIILATAAVLLLTCAAYALVVFADYRRVVGPHQEEIPFSLYQDLKTQALSESAEWLDGAGVLKSIVNDRDGLGLMLLVQNPSGGIGVDFLLVKSGDKWSVSNHFNWGQL